MRDYILLYVNGKRHEIRGETTFASLTDFLRRDLGLCGTKVVCSEGDCGACTVLVGRPDGDALQYETVDACIQFLYQLDGRHVVTVEGLGTTSSLSPVQQAVIDHHGSQCGFCTPGFVVALAGMFEEQPTPGEAAMRTALTGNLCRCTGYLPILEAAASVDSGSLRSVERLYANEGMKKDLHDHTKSPVLIRGRRIISKPQTLEEALDFKTRHPEAVIVSGGTELGVLRNKRGYDPPVLLSLTTITDLGQMMTTDHTLSIGANVTWRQLEAYARNALPELYAIIIRFGSPQIRNVSTVVANVAHGSPIADSLPFLLITDSEVETASKNGTRRVKIDGFYKGYKAKDLAADEIITRLLIPLPAPDEWVKLYKVSRRKDLDIATFGAGIRIKRAGEVITRAFVAYSGVGPTVSRLPATEAFLQGKLLSEATFREAGRVARSEVKPISDVRGTRDFRLQLAENILSKFYFDCREAEGVKSCAAG
jgi:xanthine dehydrogenase small subunit